MKRSNNMLRFIYILMLTVFAGIIVNVFVVTIFHTHIRSGVSLNPYVKSVSQVSETVFASRGNIYDANGEIVARDTQTWDIICYLDHDRMGNKNTPAYVDDPLYTSQVLSTFLDMEQAEIYQYLTAHPDWYQTELGLKGRNISDEVKKAILAYPNIHGIDFRPSYKRYYAKGSDFAPYLIGFAQSDDTGKIVGKMGLEAYLNEELSGTDGKHVYQRDKNGYVLPGMYENEIPAENGYDVYLTIDTSIQDALETSFDEVTEQNGASKAWGAVVEISTGKILAWGQTPSFDPNILDIEDYMNYGSQATYEPGSVMKAFIYATAMDLGTYNGTNTFDSDSYCYLSKGSEPYRTYGDKYYGCISNAAGKSWGTIELDYGLILSSNVATSTLLSDYVGSENYMNYLKKFGFFQHVDTDGILDSTGLTNYDLSPADKLSLTYGQGSSVTMLQLIQAYTAIFGNGEMIKPYYIDKIVDTDNDTIVYRGERTVVSTPIKESTAKQMQQLLRRVVADPKGTAKFYAIDKVDIMAKTGTSEIAVGSGYNSDDSITSVMLAFPSDEPKYMIYYAYVSPYDYYNHTYSKPITNLIQKVAILTDVGYNPSDAQTNNSIVRYDMKDVVGENFMDARNMLEEMNLNVIKIGDGNKVTRQYPEVNDTVYTNQKVLLYTDSANIQIPDFTGWTRKEIISYWNITGIPIIMDGYGVVYEQSISSGSYIDKNSEITVKLSDIYSTYNFEDNE